MSACLGAQTEIDRDLEPRRHDLERLAGWLDRFCARPSWARVRQMA